MTKPKGMQVKKNGDARDEAWFVDRLRTIALNHGFSEVIIPTVWHTDTFIDKAGPEILKQMYVFPDKKGRELCLIPEVTAVIQELWKGWWQHDQKKPYKVFYASRCYRYENVQAGRYREFLQFGVEILGGKEDEREEEQELLYRMARSMLSPLGAGNYEFNESVKRGLDYYVEDGFEAEVPTLGAQKQVLGGGRYDGGIGYAIGVSRVMHALEQK